MTHSNETDYNCPTCHWLIKVGIPHECNFMLCHYCHGAGFVGWRASDICPSCDGDGRWHNDPEEENPKGVLDG